jgi:[ribosomal protein S18]-alanine N-acetyltransferase
MNYRLFEHEDFDELYAIEEVCFQPPQRFSPRYMLDLVHRSRAATWMAEESSRLAGFAIIEWSTRPAGIEAYITTIEVLPEMRCRGIGSELLRRVEGSAQSAGAVEVWLHVDAKNSSAIRLYEVHGYRVTGEAENYYARGRAAKIYMKPLSR